MANTTHQHLHAGHRIAERFELTSPYNNSLHTYGIEAWRAKDSVLSRELRALIIPSDHPQRARTIDSARKAGLFDDPQTTAVLYVSDTDEISAIFTEFPLGKPLANYLTGDPLPESLVTAIIGEAATAINHARHRGLRHLQISAQHFYISDSGELTLDGIAIFAALAGVNTDRLSEELDRDEARGLLVLYAALLEGKDFPSDPNEHQGFIERAAHREDLPDRIRDVFTSELRNAGSTSAADLLRRIVPWGEIPMNLLPELKEPNIPDIEDSLSAENLFNDELNSLTHNDFSHEISDMHDQEVESQNEQNEIVDIGNDKDDIHDGDNYPDSDADSFDAILYGEYELIHENEQEALSIREDSFPNKQPEMESQQNTALESKKNTDTFFAGASASDTPASDSSNSSNTSASEDSENQSYNYSQTMFYAEPVVGSGRKSLTVSTIVIAIFALGVLIALLAGVFKLLSPLDPVDVETLNAEREQAAQSAQDKAGSSASKSQKDSTSHQSTQKPKVPSIAKVSFIYANPELPEIPDAAYLFDDAPKAGDGDPSTEFRSWYFTNPLLNEIDQFGLLIELDEETDVSEVILNTGGEGGTIQLRTATAEDPIHGEVLSEESVSAATELSVSSPVTAKYLALWVTQMPRDKQSGENLLRVTDIAVK